MTIKKTGRDSNLPDILKRLEQIKDWAAQGLKEEQIAANVGVGTTAWYKHKKANRKIANAVKEGRLLYRQSLVPKLEIAAAEAACGYETKEIKQVFDDNKQLVRTEIVTKRVPPKETLLIFLLLNLLPEQYKDKRNLSISGEGDGKINITIKDDYGDK